MNILDKTDRANYKGFGKDTSMNIKQRQGWADPKGVGEFRMIEKTSLNIDGRYQRDEVSKGKVIAIARDWDWRLFSTVSVICRDDGSLWVFDGGHRTRAAFYRDDIMDLPCMVFKAEDIKEESSVFIGTNTMKSAVSAYHKHRAAVVSGDANALAVESIATKYGYVVNDSSNSVGGFQAVGMLGKMVQENPTLADDVFALCAEIADGSGTIKASVLRGIFKCAIKVADKEDILSGRNREKLTDHTLETIELCIRREKHIIGRGGEGPEVKAILDIINKGRRRKVYIS